jgi:hypothetical protein
MNPERRNEIALALITWLVTALGWLTVAVHWRNQNSLGLPRMEGDDVLLNLMFPVTGIVVGLVACFERPRSGVKRSVSPFGLMPVSLCALVAAGVVTLWLKTPG